jgi:hypothetical protein
MRVGADYDSSGEVEGRLKRLGQGAESARTVRRASRQRDVNEQGQLLVEEKMEDYFLEPFSQNESNYLAGSPED